MITKIFLIALITVLIVDDSGFIDSVKYFIGKCLNIKPDRVRFKPFECSYCMTFWCGMSYLVYANELTLINVAIVLIFSSFTTQINDILNFFKDTVTLFVNFVSNKLYKLLT